MSILIDESSMSPFPHQQSIDATFSPFNCKIVYFGLQFTHFNDSMHRNLNNLFFTKALLTAARIFRIASGPDGSTGGIIIIIIVITFPCIQDINESRLLALILISHYLRNLNNLIRIKFGLLQSWHDKKSGGKLINIH